MPSVCHLLHLPRECVPSVPLRPLDVWSNPVTPTSLPCPVHPSTRIEELTLHDCGDNAIVRVCPYITLCVTPLYHSVMGGVHIGTHSSPVSLTKNNTRHYSEQKQDLTSFALNPHQVTSNLCPPPSASYIFTQRHTYKHVFLLQLPIPRGVSATTHTYHISHTPIVPPQ
jgi:hypothetical protein